MVISWRDVEACADLTAVLEKSNLRKSWIEEKSLQEK
jgi:hypothetical protein